MIEAKVPCVYWSRASLAGKDKPSFVHQEMQDNQGLQSLRR